MNRPPPVAVGLPRDLAVPQPRREELTTGRAADASQVHAYEQALAQLRQAPFRVVERDLNPGSVVTVTDQDLAAGILRRASIVCSGRAEVTLLVVGDKDLEPIAGATSNEQVAHPPELWVARQHVNDGSDILQRLDPAHACLSRCQLAVVDQTARSTRYLLSENEPIADLLHVEVVVTGNRITAFHTWQGDGTENPNDAVESTALVSDLPANEQLIAPDPQTVLEGTDLDARQRALPGADDVTTIPPSDATPGTYSPATAGYSYCPETSPAPATG